jgi:HAD superfamily hydrolase (TIGR01490 family)
MQLALFDLDHTLLSGDSDLLWCDYLIRRGVLDPGLRERAAEMAADYTAGTVTPRDYCDFFASTLAGRTPEDLQPLREGFFRDEVRPRIPEDARALLARHREAGDTLVLTTATSRVVSGLTAADLGVDHYLCTELQMVDGRYTGRTTGAPNMRTGKLERLREWLAVQGLDEQLLRRASFYSDSINDLALLSVVGRPTVVDPDPRLASAAARKGWAVLRFDRRR